MRGERGAALLIALGGLALISALAAAALALTTGPAARAGAAVDRAQASRAAEAAIHRFAAAIARPEERRRAPLDGTVIETTLLDVPLSISAQDLGGLIDLNAAPEPILARLLRATGADGATAARIAGIWEATRARAGARRAFLDPEDALEPLAPEDRAAARPALAHATTRSGRATVALATATAPALAAAADVTLDAARAHVAARAARRGGARLPPAGFNDGALHLDTGRAVRITAIARTARGGRATVTAIVEITPSPAEPLRFLAWR